MAAPDVTKIERSPGKIVKNPTTLAIAFPYGGTALGAVRGVAAEIMSGMDQVPAEEFGGIPVETVGQGEWVILGSLFRQWDSDAMAAIFRNTTTGGAGGTVVNVDAAAAVRAGVLGSSLAAKILFAPNDPTQHGLLLYAAVPVIARGSKASWSILRETALETSWLGLPDGTGRIYRIGKLADLSL